MRRNLARPKAPASSCLGAAPDQAEEPQPRHRGIALLVAVALLLALAPSASASIQFERQWGSQGSGNGQFNNPVGVATDSAGNVYVADAYNDRIQKFDSSGTFITKWGSQGTGDGQFNAPRTASPPTPRATSTSPTRQQPDPEVRLLGHFLRMWGWGVDDGSNAFQICTSSVRRVSRLWDGQFDYPDGIATDSVGQRLRRRHGNNRIQKFDSSGTFITKWGSIGTGDGQFHSPSRGVATDSAGNVYVADAGNNRIQKFDSSGAFITKWGSSRLRGRPVRSARRRRHRLRGQRLRRRHGATTPDPEVRLLGRLHHQVGKLRLGGRPVQLPVRRRHRLGGQRLRRRRSQQPDPEVPRRRPRPRSTRAPPA